MKNSIHKNVRYVFVGRRLHIYCKNNYLPALDFFEAIATMFEDEMTTTKDYFTHSSNQYKNCAKIMCHINGNNRPLWFLLNFDASICFSKDTRRNYISISIEDAVIITRCTLRGAVQYFNPILLDMLWTPYFKEACRMHLMVPIIYKDISIPTIKVRRKLYRNYEVVPKFGVERVFLMNNFPPGSITSQGALMLSVKKNGRFNEFLGVTEFGKTIIGTLDGYNFEKKSFKKKVSGETALKYTSIIKRQKKVYFQIGCTSFEISDGQLQLKYVMRNINLESVCIDTKNMVARMSTSLQQDSIYNIDTDVLKLIELYLVALKHIDAIVVSKKKNGNIAVKAKERKK